MSTLDPRFFCYKEDYFGGTEYMARRFHRDVAPYIQQMKKNYNCIVMPGVTDIEYQQFIFDPKPIILWLHNLVDQFCLNLYLTLTDQRFLNKIAYIITVSEWHRQDVIAKTKIDPEKVIVIPKQLVKK